LKELLLKWLELQLNKQPPTADELEARTRAFVIRVVTWILLFIVIALIYSVTFVTQPIKAMAPIDQAYTKMLNDIVLLIVGGIGGIMTKGAANEAANMMSAVKAGKDAYVAPPVQTVTMEAWTPPPAPTRPPMLEPDQERETMAMARQEVNNV
jgi:hypothetical protein